MPPEPTNAAKRRSNRREVEEFKFDGGHAREIESKRSRGEISCAECRRLKIKCDKTIPCTSCQRRGCGSLCPNGSLATGQGTRFVLAATEHLHKRIAKISDRVRQLEDALAMIQSKHYNEPHPLLRDDLLSANTIQEDDGDGTTESPAGPSNPPEIMDAFGTLSISEHGISRFFGPTGGPESLLMAGQSSSHTSQGNSRSPESIRDSKSPSSLPGDLTMFSQSFPFSPVGPAVAVQEVIEGHLPAWERALYLAETYLEGAAWLFRGVARPQLVEEMLPVFYKHQVPYTAQPEEDYGGPHDLALLFMVFAIGALVDLRQDPSNPEAEHYHQIARAAICLQPVLEKPSLVTIQTLHLLSIYNAMSSNEVGSNETSMETTWSLITLATHLSQTIGLHRDSARWGLSPKMVERRRILFWDLFVADAWQSLNTGRPPSFSLAYIDCRFPHDDEQKKNAQGDTEPGYGSWGFRFAMECVADVAARTLTAEAPSYTTIMDLDRKVREFPLPEDALAIAASSTPISDDKLPPALAMMRCVMSHTREVILLYIHRSFFAQAIIEHPANPLKSLYAPSFLAAYRASATILRTIREHFAIQPALCSRFWSMWTFAFSAAVVFGTIVTRGPKSPLASNAMTELDQACILFSKAAVHSRRASKALSILTRLREKAHNALASAQTGQPSSLQHHGSLWNVKQEDNEDELAIFSGRTRFVSSKKESPSPSPFTPHPSGEITPPFALSRHDSQSVPETSSYYSDGPPSSSPMNTWPADTRREDFAPRDEYRQANQEHFIPSQERRISQPFQSPSHYAPHEQIQIPSTPNYDWQNSNPHFYGSQSGQHHYPPPPPRIDDFQHHQQHQPGQSFGPGYPGHQPLPPPSELSDLGLASRDSRLDERWSSFMQDSGLLDGINYNNTGRSSR